MTDLPLGPAVAGVEAPLRPRRRTYAGRFVRLVPVDADDADALFADSHGDARREALWTYLPYGPFADARAMRTWIEGIAPGEDPMFFCVRQADTGAPLGMVSYLRIEPEHRCQEIGHIWYLPAAQRTRANTEAAYLMMEETFDTQRCRRLEWKCDALNARSRAAALRLGFTFESIFRQHRIVRDRNRDTAWYSLLDGEWPRKREHLRRWLYDNDDGALSLTALNGATAAGA